MLSTKHVQDGRQLLREVLAGPLRFTPDGRKYRFEGDAAFGGMLAGIAGVAPFVVAVTSTVKGCRTGRRGPQQPLALNPDAQCADGANRWEL